MNARRFNDILKIVGSVVAAMALFGPILAKPHANLGALVSDLLSMLPGAVAAFGAGMGTRGVGLEYQDVADAKAKAATVPPAAGGVS
jgi:hypothetical protein